MGLQTNMNCVAMNKNSPIRLSNQQNTNIYPIKIQ